MGSVDPKLKSIQDTPEKKWQALHRKTAGNYVIRCRDSAKASGSLLYVEIMAYVKEKMCLY